MCRPGSKHCNESLLLGQRHLFICNLYVRRLHRQMPVLKVVVKVEALVQHHLFVRLQQAEGKVFK